MDDELMRAYRTATGGRVQVYIGYYRHQRQGKELTGEVGHALQAVASGLTINVDAKKLHLNEIVHDNAGTQQGLVFWYDVNGRILSNVYIAKAYSIWDALVRRRTNAAVVMIAWTAGEGLDSQRARKDAIDFAGALVPVLRRHLPS
jgi:EpsI family protein